MTAEALDTEYENGVADVLGYLAGDAATVERNVRMPGRRSGKRRQIDVRVTGTLFGTADATMVVDCKRYSKPLDVNHVGTFVSLVEDVGAEIGLLVSTMGITSAAQQYADSVRGIRLVTLSIEELASWSPAGTVNFVYAVGADVYPEAVRAARRAGFRVREVPLEPSPGDELLAFSAFRHLGVSSQPRERAIELQQQLLTALERVGITEPEFLEIGAVAHGGTPAYRHLEITLAGNLIGETLHVSSEEEITGMLDATAHDLNVDRKQLNVIRPEVWPIPTIFPHWKPSSHTVAPEAHSGLYLVIRGTDDGGADITTSDGRRYHVPPGAQA